eukprot:gene10518-7482_t
MSVVALASAVVKVIGKIEEAVQQVTANRALCQSFAARLAQFEIILSEPALRAHPQFERLVAVLKTFVDEAFDFIASLQPKKRRAQRGAAQRVDEVAAFLAAVRSSKQVAQRFFDLDAQLTRLRDDFCAITTIVRNGSGVGDGGAADARTAQAALLAAFAKSLRDDVVREVNKLRDAAARGEALPEDVEALSHCGAAVRETVQRVGEANGLRGDAAGGVDSDADAARLGGFVARQVNEMLSLSQLRRQPPGASAFPADDVDISARFAIGERLGAGAFGVTSAARYAGDGRRYALKQIDVARAAQLGVDEDAIEREALTLRGLRHAHVVRCVHSFFDAARAQFFVVMELAPGAPLETFVEPAAPPARPLPLARWMRQLASALVYLHGDARVLHRDVKPANVLVAPTLDAVTLVDFGTARDVDGAAAARATVGAGTPLYSSAEKLAGAAYDGRDDVWALGCVFAELALQQRLSGVVARDEAKRAVLLDRLRLVAASDRGADRGSVAAVAAAILAHVQPATRPTAADALLLLDDLAAAPRGAQPATPPPAAASPVAAAAPSAPPSPAPPTTAPLATLTSDDALLLLVRCGCCRDLAARVAANADLDAAELTGRYLADVDDVDTLQALEANATDASRSARRPLLKRALAALQRYQRDGVSLALLRRLRTVRALDEALRLVEAPVAAAADGDGGDGGDDDAAAATEAALTRLGACLDADRDRHEDTAEREDRLRRRLLDALDAAGRERRVAALNVLRRLAREERHRAAMVEAADVLARLVALLRRGDDVEAGVAALALCNLLRRPEAKAAARALDALPRLAALLRSAVAETRHAAAAALWSAVVDAENRAALRAVDGGFAALAALVGDADEGDETRRFAASALRLCASDKAGRGAVRAAGGVEAAVAALAAADEALREAAAAALHAALIGEAESKAALRAAGGLPRLVALLCADVRREAQLSALQALRYATLAEPQNRAALLEAQAAPAVLAALRADLARDEDAAGARQLREAAAATLRSFAIDKAAKDALREAGAIELLAALLSSAHVTVRVEAAGALRTLAALSRENKEAVGAAAIARLLPLLRDAHGGLREEAAGALGNVAAMVPRNKSAIVAGGGLALVAPLLRDASAGVRKEAVNLLRNLLVDAECRAAFAAADAFVDVDAALVAQLNEDAPFTFDVAAAALCYLLALPSRRAAIAAALAADHGAVAKLRAMADDAQLSADVRAYAPQLLALCSDDAAQT